jgi:hypothetical protein
MATAGAALFLTCGLGLIGVSLASQLSAVQPPLTTGASGKEKVAGRERPPDTTMPIVESVRTRGAASTEPRTLTRSKPTALDIPAIGVHSVLQILGQNEDGTLETPAVGPHYNEAAWYRYSPTPGSLGPAILMGHIDSAAEGPSVFFRLGELTPGDRISVSRADGSTARFVVDRVRRYPKDAFPTKLVYGNIGHAGLRLLTCGGAFDATTGHYLDNIVVFASFTGSRARV